MGCWLTSLASSAPNTPWDWAAFALSVLGGVGALAAVIVAVVALNWQRRAEREGNRITRLVNQEERMTRRVEELQRVASAIVNMTHGYDEVAISMPDGRYQRARTELMVALAGFARGAFPAIEPLLDVSNPDDFPALRGPATDQSSSALAQAVADRDARTSQLDNLLSPG